MQVVHFFCTQFQNFWHIMRLSINKHRQVIEAQIFMLNSCYSQFWQNFRGW